MALVLTIDVGNTNTILGLFRYTSRRNIPKSKAAAKRRLVATWRVHTDISRTPEEHLGMVLDMLRWNGFDSKDIQAVCLCSVVPPVTPPLEEMSQRFLGTPALVVGAHISTGVRIEYEDPTAVGADRLVNAVAAYHFHGGPCIVVDFGTATTFDAISHDGAYLGGAIAPGITISAEALFQRAAKLPRIQLQPPQYAIGRSTVTSMQSGIVFGYIGLVKELVARFKSELGNAHVIATGGLATMMAPLIDSIDEVELELTLLGLYILFERNRTV